MLITLALLAAATPQEALPPARPPTKERKICRASATTGSRMGSGRVCRTKAEWVAIDAANAGGIDRAHVSVVQRRD